MQDTLNMLKTHYSICSSCLCTELCRRIKRSNTQ